jgi:pimeloyl-ACP methyl ester carboxylesterase
MNFENDKISPYSGYTMHEFDFGGCPCIVVEPANPIPGKRWVWKAEFFTAFPKFELEMLRRGWYLCFMSVGNTFGCPDAMQKFNTFYDFLTKVHGFHSRPVLLGLSRGGLYVYNWACANPEKTGCVYADNPVCDFKSWPGGKGIGPGSPDDWTKLLADYHFADEAEALAYPQPIDNVGILLQAGVPLVHAARTEDEIVPIAENTDVMEARVKALGGSLKVFRHPGNHHPHGLDDPAPMADWIEANTLN